MGSIVKLATAGAEYTRTQAGIDAARTVQTSGNNKRAAIASAQRGAQSIGNTRIMDAAGAQVGALSENIARNLDAATSGKLSGRIAAAEELGSTVAGAAAAGIGGSSVDLYKATLNLHESMSEEAGTRAVETGIYIGDQQKRDTLNGATAAFNNSVINPDLDFTKYVDAKKPSGLGTGIALAAAAAATYFGGPQAGDAVLQGYGAITDAQKGNYAGAQRGFDAAVGEGIAGFKTYTSLGGATKADGTKAGGEAWGAHAFDSFDSFLSHLKI